MRLESLTLYNFKNYYGKNTIEFSSKKDKSKNITLIGGLNGAGKTTALEAIKLCLYGKNYNGIFISQKDYEKYIIKSVNRKSTKENNKKIFIELKIKFDDSYPSISLDIKRMWDVKDYSTIKENFEIFRDSNPLEFISVNYWQDYINSLIPINVAEFFFFNGEKVREIAVGTNADEILKSSIKDLIGLTLYENLINDLNKLKSKIRRRNLKKKDVETTLQKFEELKKQKNKKIGKINKTIAKKTLKIKEKEILKKDINNELKLKAGSTAEENKKLQNELLTLKEENAQLNERITIISKDFLPFVIPKKLCKNLINQINFEQNEKIAAQLRILQKEKMKKFDTVFKEKSNFFKKLNKNDRKMLLDEINSIIIKVFKEKQKGKKILHNDLTISEIENIKNYFKNSDNNINKKYNNILKKREENNIKINKIKSFLNKIPDDTFVVENIDKISSIKAEIDSLNQDITNLGQEHNKITDEVSTLDRSIENYEEQIICKKEDIKKLSYIERIISSIEDYIIEIIKINTTNLENNISTIYHNLANKDDMVKDIRINPQNFTTQLYDYDGKPISKEGISEGEKEIYALSILWGLSQISHHTLPLIIDTPLAKLDNKHVKNITTEFFPKVSDQVILLSQDREIDKNIYGLLKPHINQSYTLMQSDENKIKSGYFYDG